MKRLRWSLVIALALVAVVAGAWLAPRLLQDPGYALIEFGGWRVQMSFVVLLGAVLASWALISLLVALLRLPGRAVRKARQARSQRALDRGLLALSEGDWERAEKSLARALRDPGSQTAGLLAAARAAHGKGEPEQRDRYLQRADSKFGRHQFTTALVRARLLGSEGRHAEAVALLEELHLQKPRHQGVLKMLLDSYQHEERWHDVRLLLPAMRRAGIVDSARADELEALAAGRELRSAPGVDELLAMRASMRRALRRQPEVVTAFAARALELDRADLTEAPLARALDHARSADLLALYAQSDTADRTRRIERCQAWLKSEPDNPDLHLALGRLYLEHRDDDRARHHLQIAVQHSSDPRAYAALGQVLDRAGLIERAAQCYRNALRIGQGRAPEPLPSPGE